MTDTRKVLSMRPTHASSLALFALALAGFTAGCSDPGGVGDTLAAATDTVAGIERWTWPEGGAVQLDWRLDTVAVIGGFDASGEEYQFDQVGAGGLVGDREGNLFVLDGAGRRVLGYDGTGALIGAWGREGNGPGEFANPGGLAVAPDGALWVTDDGNRRVTIIQRQEGQEAVSIPLAESAGAVSGDIALSDGGLYGVLRTFRFSPGDDSGPPPLALVHMNLEGTYDDTLWTAERPHMDQVEARMGNQVMMMLVTQAFASGFFWERFANGTFAVVEGPEYVIHLLDADGGEMRTIRRDPPAREPTDEDIEGERERQRDRAPPSNMPGAEQLMEKRLEALTFAGRIPRITGLAVDMQDRLWVGVSMDTPGETDRIDVYGADGALLGEIGDPEFFPDLIYGDGLVARITADELDVQQIAVYELVEGGSAAD